MPHTPDPAGLYLAPAAAWVRSQRPDLACADDLATVQAGAEQGVRLQRFKRTSVLPRVRAVLGTLRALSPRSLLDIGSGRGAFLWPLLEAFPQLPVTAIDSDERRAAQLEAVAVAGMPSLRALRMDATRLSLPDRSFDVVTALEVLEHIPDCARALNELVRIAQRFVIVSVPSRPDDNPGHLHLLGRATLERWLADAGVKKFSVQGVLNHLLVTARVT